MGFQDDGGSHSRALPGVGRWGWGGAAPHLWEGRGVAQSYAPGRASRDTEQNPGWWSSGLTPGCGLRGVGCGAAWELLASRPQRTAGWGPGWQRTAALGGRSWSGQRSCAGAAGVGTGRRFPGCVPPVTAPRDSAALSWSRVPSEAGWSPGSASPADAPGGDRDSVICHNIDPMSSVISWVASQKRKATLKKRINDVLGEFLAALRSPWPPFPCTGSGGGSEARG